MENRTDILNELNELSTVVAAIGKANVFMVPEGYFEYLSNDIINGIKAENGLLIPAVAKLNSDVPAGYFDSLADSILNKIKAQDIENAATEIQALSPVLSGLQNKNIFETPVGYFDTLPDNVLQKIKTQHTKDAAAELRTLSPMLYSIQNENVFEIPQGYFEKLGDAVLNKVKPQPKVITMQRRSSTFLKYAVAAAFTGVMALGVFKFTGKHSVKTLPEYVTAGMQIDDIDGELAKISDADIVKYLEANGTDVKAAYVANSVDENELPSQEDYLLDEKALDKYLNSINLDDLKN
jgi:adenylate kinase